MFEAVYGSTWHHPVAFWVVGLAVLGLLVARRARSGSSFALSALIVFQGAILLDAWITSAWSPFEDGSAAKTAAAVAFVILGDLRYFVLLERYGRPEAEGKRIERWLVVPLIASLVVPIGSKLAAAPWPDQPRVLFLVYELMFATLALGIRFGLLPRRRGRMRAPRWVTRLTTFEVVQYLLWASADVVILMGMDVGFLLRLIPNFMYYAVFVPFAWWTCPEEITS